MQFQILRFDMQYTIKRTFMFVFVDTTEFYQAYLGCPRLGSFTPSFRTVKIKMLDDSGVLHEREIFKFFIKSV